MGRPSKDEYYLKIALAVSERSTCLRRNYGAVIVKNDRIISTGYNGAPRGIENCCDSGKCKRNELGIPKGAGYELCQAVHAEQNALISANGQELIGSTIYIAGTEAVKDSDESKLANPAPCAICEKMIRNAAIAKVVGLGVDGKPQEINI